MTAVRFSVTKELSDPQEERQPRNADEGDWHIAGQAYRYHDVVLAQASISRDESRERRSCCFPADRNGRQGRGVQDEARDGLIGRKRVRETSRSIDRNGRTGFRRIGQTDQLVIAVERGDRQSSIAVPFGKDGILRRGGDGRSERGGLNARSSRSLPCPSSNIRKMN